MLCLKFLTIRKALKNENIHKVCSVLLQMMLSNIYYMIAPFKTRLYGLFQQELFNHCIF